MIQLLVEAAAIGKPREGVMMGKKEDVLFRFLARTKIADRNRAMRLSREIEGSLSEFDRNFRPVGMCQNVLDQLVRAIEQLQTNIRVRQILLECRANYAVRGRTADEDYEIIVDGNNGVASGNQKSLDGGIGKTAHAVDVKFVAPKLARFDRATTKR